uniref:40S ribosomal protein S10-B n=1 Tax=Lygus hesperus TaxID=30085 RepID=A0A0A9ZDQ3_LYGHE
MKLMEELKAKGIVTEVFSWQWLYYILTDSGIAYLRTYLHLTPETVPNTHKRVELVPLIPSYGSNQGHERAGGMGTGGTRRGPSYRGNDFTSQPHGAHSISARN